MRFSGCNPPPRSVHGYPPTYPFLCTHFPRCVRAPNVGPLLEGGRKKSGSSRHVPDGESRDNDTLFGGVLNHRILSSLVSSSECQRHLVLKPLPNQLPTKTEPQRVLRRRSTTGLDAVDLQPVPTSSVKVPPCGAPTVRRTEVSRRTRRRVVPPTEGGHVH